MKTYKNLWQDFISFENLYTAAKKAEKRKRWKPEVLIFNNNLEENILLLQKDLVSGQYKPGMYKTFKIFEPKERIICAAPYRDRILHHAINNIIEPIWEKRFYYHSYACRVDKGMHRAIDVCQEYLRKNKYILKCDIEKFFPSVDHVILKKLLMKRIGDQKFLNVINLILDYSPNYNMRNIYYEGDDLFSPVERRKGIPIGNLTSQFFANVFLHELDTFIKFNKRVQYYVRYMDDFIIFHDSKEYLLLLKKEIKIFLESLRLNLHKKKQQIFPAKNGVPFLGFHIYKNNRRLQKGNIRRFVQRMKEKIIQYSDDEINLDDIRTSIQAWIGHAKHGNTWKIRTKLFSKILLN